MYSTFSYDAAWAVFLAMHCAIHGCEGTEDKSTSFIRQGTSVQSTLGSTVTATKVLEAMYLIDFWGASGRVQFRQGEAPDYNYKGDREYPPGSTL